ncbi:MAG: imidazole glycerol phosphate synthase subunit HisH [Streptococcaceae bacterium]|jgi:glutamine amidotransferase|nr:imidazole glycerol phosphate synthase subunit HisH [Streptococcaceae bacterium]
MSNEIVIIDYEVGNLQSVESALTRIGLTPVISRDPETIQNARAIILPGVGAFPAAMAKLHEFHLVELLQEEATTGKPFLGICLGMQVLFESGSEVTPTPGLGLLKGTVDKIQTTEKLPHMGWNQLHLNQPTHPLVQNLNENEEVYFVHSFQANSPENQHIATTSYGGEIIPAIVGRDNVLGCQFHPEKSGPIGRKILEAFKEMLK